MNYCKKINNLNRKKTNKLMNRNNIIVKKYNN